MITLKSLLEDYLSVIPEEASKEQVIETKRAFVAGMLNYRNLALEAASMKSLEIAETKLQSYERELEELIEEVNDA